MHQLLFLPSDYVVVEVEVEVDLHLSIPTVMPARSPLLLLVVLETVLLMSVQKLQVQRVELTKTVSAQLDEVVALKLLPPSHLSREHIDRFIKEAQICSRIEHPNVVTIYTIGETPARIPALAMEYVDGEALFTYLSAAAPLPLVELGFQHAAAADVAE